MKKKLLLNGLDCAHCAQKIVDKLELLDGVSEATLNFPTKTLSLEYNNRQTLAKCKELIVQIEPDVKVSEKTAASADDEQAERVSLVTIIIIAAGILLYPLSYISAIGTLASEIIKVLSYLLISHKIFFNLFRKLKRFDFFDENFLMVVASLGALCIGDSLEGIAVMLFFQVGELAQQRAVDNSRKSISALMEIKPETARLVKDGFEAEYPPEEISVGDVVKVLPGEKIPLEGIILSGETLLDTSALTGESIPVEAGIGDEVLSGSINKTAVITIRVSRPFSESTVARILDLVENSAAKKSKSENFITKFARVYTPIVVGAAVLLAVIGTVITGNTSDWLYRSLSFLVVSCPCALVLSVPLSYFCAIGAGAKHGVMIKGGNYLEKLTKIDTIVFDKTGTLTTGKFKIDEVIARNNFDSNEILRLAAIAESNSTHPIARSIALNAGDFLPEKLTYCEEISASGVKAVYDGKQILVGSARLLKSNNIEFERSEKNCVYVVIDGVFAGIITITDEIKSNTASAIKELKNYGISKTVMLTGDNKAAALDTAKQAGIDECKYQLLPEDKASAVEQLSKTRSVAFVGDGMNDAPVISLADVGFSMGSAGSDSAIEASDVVLMNDNPQSVVTALNLAQRTKQKVISNIIFCLAVKAVIMVLSALGIQGIMWAAVFADVGVALIAVLNSMQLLKFKANQ